MTHRDAGRVGRGTLHETAIEAAASAIRHSGLYPKQVRSGGVGRVHDGIEWRDVHYKHPEEDDEREARLAAAAVDAVVAVLVEAAIHELTTLRTPENRHDERNAGWNEALEEAARQLRGLGETEPPPRA